MPAVLASSARVDGNACPSVLLFAFSMGPRAPPDQGGMSLPPLAVTDRETISGLCVKTRETEEWGRSGGRGTRYTHYSASRLPQNSTGPHPEFPNLYTPPPCSLSNGRVGSGPGLVGLLIGQACSHIKTHCWSQKKNSRSASPLLFLPDRPPS